MCTNMFAWLLKILCQTFIAFDQNKIIYNQKKKKYVCTYYILIAKLQQNSVFSLLNCEWCNFENKIHSSFVRM